MALKQVILVAGFDYENVGLGFSAMVQNRIALLQKKLSKDELRFITIDFGLGTITTLEKDPKTKKWVKTNPTREVIVPNPNYDSINDPRWFVPQMLPYTFTPVSSANYADWSDKKVKEKHFTENPFGIMSVTDVYDFIVEIGKGAEKGTVIELSFMSHGFFGGPVLVNSKDHKPSEKARDPLDKDPRPDKDFSPPQMDPAKLSEFKNAFASGAIIWSWGCVFAKARNIILQTLFKNPKFKGKALTSTKDTDKFHLVFSEDKSEKDGAARFDDIKNRLAAFGTMKKGEFVVEITWKEFKDVFKKGLDATFSQQVADQVKITCIGAFPGTYADPFDGLMAIIQDKDKASWTKAESKKKKPEPFHSFSRSIKFYTVALGKSQDPENRGYGVFTPK